MIYNFTPTDASIPFTFKPTLDGIAYNARIWWNVQGQRCYITLSTLTGTPVFTLPLIESSVFYPISITAAYFNSTLVYYADNMQIEVLP